MFAAGFCIVLIFASFPDLQLCWPTKAHETAVSCLVLVSHRTQICLQTQNSEHHFYEARVSLTYQLTITLSLTHSSIYTISLPNFLTHSFTNSLSLSHSDKLTVAYSLPLRHFLTNSLSRSITHSFAYSLFH